MNKKLVIVPVLPGASSGVFTSQSARHGDNQIQDPGVWPILRQGYISLTNAGADQYIRDQGNDPGHEPVDSASLSPVLAPAVAGVSSWSLMD